jgi:hypothetical protein
MAKARLEPKPESHPVVVATPTARPTTQQRFADNDDGTVTDNQTGLIWLKDANCFGDKNWSTAMDLAGRLRNGQCGLRDGSVARQWRLPRKEEWAALIDENARSPALPSSHPFTGVKRNSYWSSYVPSTGNAWLRNLFDGGVGMSVKANTFYVWPVRGGP